GRTFKEALQKGMRSLEHHAPWNEDVSHGRFREMLLKPRPDRIHWILAALEAGVQAAEICDATKIDPWFVRQMEEIVSLGKRLADESGGRESKDDAEAQSSRRSAEKKAAERELLWEAKRNGFSDEQLAAAWKTTTDAVRQRRAELNVTPVFKRVDTCAAEFESYTPYLYSTYEEEDEADVTARPKVVILGSGPNRIGQGIEFDYCCCHAAFALKEDGYETVMVNCNPETVSTDYDTSDRLYFEPLTLEDVLAITEREKPRGVIVQFGGQTPLNLALDLKRNGVNILGTAPESIDLAEDRKQFGRILDELEIPQPRNGTAVTAQEAMSVASSIGLPVLVRPSYVLGGRAMVIA
ncbi:MAG: carbamoyl-phosphate synthase large subunit, partial [Candidatus Acidiferrales bacterium]